jgi:tripartite motif-containing protein 71
MMDLNSKSGLLIFVLVGIVMLSAITSNNNTYAALKDPTGVAVDPSGNVFTSEWRKNIIQKFTNTGTFIRQWESEGKQPATDSLGNVYVVSNNQIIKYTNTGKFITKMDWDSPPGSADFNVLGRVAVDSSGNIFVLDSFGSFAEGADGSRIVKFTNNGTFIKQWAPRCLAHDIDVDSSGNVFVTGCRVEKYTNDGKFIREWGKFVGGIAVDKSNGNIFVLVTNLTGKDDHVEKYTNTGKFIRKWGSTGEEKGQFDNPSDIAVDSKGYVFVADTGMDRIQKFSNTGKFIREWGHVRGGEGGNITTTSLSPSASISSVPMDMETGAPLALQ